MVPGWKHIVVSQSHIDREKKIKFYVVAEAGEKMFCSSCLIAMDVKTGFSSAMLGLDRYPESGCAECPQQWRRIPCLDSQHLQY